ncbi:MAG: 3-deoxy-D-manno-octulosonic acid transferase [Pyrinomonadaceae bacterium]
MFFLYSFLLTLAFILMSPLFILRRRKYAAGFRQRLGNYSAFIHDGRKVIWLHCVSVGETNAARPLVDELKVNFPNHRLVISTTTLTGQTLAQNIFKDKVDAVFYFPFDWKFSVRKALANYKPSIVLLMETEIWPRFIREAKKSGAKVAIVNGRLSAKSFDRYSRFKPFVRRVFADVDIALMQGDADAKRITSLGMDQNRIKVAGNLKFDLHLDAAEADLAAEFRERFAISTDRPLIVAASTHSPEELWMLEAFAEFFLEPSKLRPRLMIAPRHPERFDDVAEQIASIGVSRFPQFKPFLTVRRSATESGDDKASDVILLDSVGELRAFYQMADIVFVGGSLVPHGGQSVLEPAAAGKAIITGPLTHNFESVVNELIANHAIVQLPEVRDGQVVDWLFDSISDLFEHTDERERLGKMAAKVMAENRGSTARTVGYLKDSK